MITATTPVNHPTGLQGGRHKQDVRCAFGFLSSQPQKGHRIRNAHAFQMCGTVQTQRGFLLCQDSTGTSRRRVARPMSSLSESRTSEWQWGHVEYPLLGWPFTGKPKGNQPFWGGRPTHVIVCLAYSQLLLNSSFGSGFVLILNAN